MEAHLYERLYMFIVQEIEEGRLKPGERVFSEKELAERFGVSRITSKKALEKLADAGIIRRIQGKGSFVTDRSTPEVGPPHHSEPRLSLAPDEQDRPVIGLLIPNFSDEFGLQLLRSMEERCAELQYDLIIKRTYGGREEEKRAIRLFVHLGVKGLIVVPIHGEHYNSELLRLVLDKFPVVLADRYLKGIPVCSVYTDNKKASMDLTLSLIKRGYDQIAYLSSPVENTPTLEERLYGYTLACTLEGLKLNQDYCLTNFKSVLPMNQNGTETDGDKEIMKRFLVQYPDIRAFVTSEFLIATMLAQVIDSMGLPLEQYEIACFDSLGDSLGKPIFTHIQQDEKRMGQEAVDMLVSQLNGETVPERKIIEHRLVVKDGR